MNTSRKVQLSPLAEEALSQATEDQAAEFMKEMEDRALSNPGQTSDVPRSVEAAAERPSGLFQETPRTLSGAE